jgi:hypothetical protein
VAGSLLTSWEAEGLAAAGTMVYVAEEFFLEVVDASNPALPVLVGSVDTPDRATGTAVAGTHVYVAVGPAGGVVVIDVSDPGAPRSLGGADTPGWAEDIAVSGDLVYVADGSYAPDGVPGLRILPVQCGATTAAPGSELEVATSGGIAVWPNPARGSASLGFEFPPGGEFLLAIYDLAGRQVRRLVHDGGGPPGRDVVVWDGRNQRGLPVASGVYVARLTGRQGSTAARFTWLR